MSNLWASLLQLPLWALGVIIVGTLTLIALIGYAFRLWRDSARKAKADEEQKAEDEAGQEGYMVSAVLGLFALLLGFTFALAVDRFDARRVLVLEESNAIGTAYLRSQLLEQPHRDRMSRILTDYAVNRVALGKATGLNTELLAKNDQLVTELWQGTVAAFPTIRDYDFSSSYIDSMNTVIDLDASRKTARLARVPQEVFTVLGIYGAGVAFVLGYVLTGWRGRISGLFLIALFTLSVLLIADLDLPNLGGIRESQAPMERLVQSLSEWQPAVFDQVPN